MVCLPPLKRKVQGSSSLAWQILGCIPVPGVVSGTCRPSVEDRDGGNLEKHQWVHGSCLPIPEGQEESLAPPEQQRSKAKP